MAERRHIRELDPYVAQRIAAGEVIDRPQAIIRELLDNSIDAGATKVDIFLEDGGISLIKVIDNGTGMDREDLSICYLSHTTSKISTIDDLYAIRTLGFRGEALASMAACSKLRIVSKSEGNEAYTVSVRDGAAEGPVESGHPNGTTVEIRDLFYSIPGRRKFLKSPQAETAACRKMVVEKALMHPKIQFRFFSQDTLRLFLPENNPVGRIIDAYASQKFDPVFFTRLNEVCGNFTLDLTCSTPSLYRNDRSFIQIFVNNRRIDDFALVQAVQYGYTDYLPGGCFPYCFVSITIDPELVDFNIHPAKREVKLRIGKEIHHQIVETIKQYLYTEQRRSRGETQVSQTTLTFQGEDEPAARKTQEPSPSRWSPSASYAASVRPTYQPTVRKADEEWVSKAREIFSDEERPSYPVTEAASASDDFIYHGQVFGVFLVVEKDETLYLIDQHAAHERVIYEELKSQVAPQPLLVPIPFEVTDDVADYIENQLSAFKSQGIILEYSGGSWQLTALPNYARTLEDEIITFIQQEVGSPEEITRKLFATISCRRAVKEGDVLDDHTARDLIRKILALEVPRCPHGRPVWSEITREELYRAVKRLV